MSGEEPRVDGGGAGASSHGGRAEGARSPLLAVRGLRKYFPVQRGLFRRRVGSVKAVDGVSFEIRASETLSLVGESGCGKTTTGRCVLRLLESDAGEILFKGQPLRELGGRALRAMRRHMQIVFQDPFSSLNPRRTVGEIIGSPMVLHGMCTPAQMEARAAEMLERVGLQPSYVSRYPHEFSGGQRQRIGIARAVAVHPELIVCDEAVSALDVSVRAQIINLLLDLQREFGLSYLFIAHDLSVVRHISTHVAVMYLGRVVEHAPAELLFRAPYHPYTQALLSAVPKVERALTQAGGGQGDDRSQKGAGASVGGGGRQRIILPGDVPSPMSPPRGCHFHTRCPVAEQRCREETPTTHDVAEGHGVACHLYPRHGRPVDISGECQA